MSDTPRTDDAAEDVLRLYVTDECYRFVEFARQLEREIDELKHDIQRAIANHSADLSWEPWARPMTVTDSMLASAKKVAPKVGRDAAMAIYRAMLKESLAR